jgi:hypothetical protein
MHPSQTALMEHPAIVPVRRTATRHLPARTKGQTAISPRGRLALAARGEQQLDLEDVQALLAEQMLAADQHARRLGAWRAQLLDMLFALSPKRRSKPAADPAAVLRLVAQLDHSITQAQVSTRRTAELLHHLAHPRPPALKILSERVQVANIQQLPPAVDLGGHE